MRVPDLDATFTSGHIDLKIEEVPIGQEDFILLPGTTKLKGCHRGLLDGNDAGRDDRGRCPPLMEPAPDPAGRLRLRKAPWHQVRLPGCNRFHRKPETAVVWPLQFPLPLNTRDPENLRPDTPLVTRREDRRVINDKLLGRAGSTTKPYPNAIRKDDVADNPPASSVGMRGDLSHSSP